MSGPGEGSWPVGDGGEAPADRGAAAAEPAAGGDETPLQRQMVVTEQALEHARQGAENAAESALSLATRLRGLERELTETRREPERLRWLLRRQERAARLAEQRLRAEQARGEEREAEVDALERRLEAQRARLRQTEQELAGQRRRADLAEHAAEVALAAQRAAERLLRRQRTQALPLAVGAEIAALGRLPSAAPAELALPAPEVLAGLSRLLDGELVLVRHRRAQGSFGGSGEVSLAGALAELEAYRAAFDSLEQLRRGVERPRAGLAAPPALPSPPAPSPSRALAQREPGPLPALPGEERPAEPVDCSRFGSALERLRAEAGAPLSDEVAAPAEPEPEPELEAVAAPESDPAPIPGPAARPWLAQALRRLVDDDPEMTGEIFVALLAAQHFAYPAPVRYDVRLHGRGFLAVTADPQAAVTRVDPMSGPRPDGERVFVLAGDLRGIAHLFTARGLARLFGRDLARVDGRKRLPAPLKALVAAPLSIAQLDHAGVEIAPSVALRLLAIGLLDGVRNRSAASLTVLYEPSAGSGGSRCGLLVYGDEPPVVLLQPPAEGATVTVVCPPEHLLAVLAGDRRRAEAIHGDPSALVTLAGWIAEMQGRPAA